MKETSSSKDFALVLSAGSIRATAHIGAIKALEEYGMIPSVVVGTSGGAIIGTLYAIGLSPEEISQYVTKYLYNRRKWVDFNLKDASRAVLTLDFRRFKGIIRGEKLEDIIYKKLGDIKTFQDLAAARSKNPKKYKELYITGVNLQDGGATVFNSFYDGPHKGYRGCTHLPIYMAVRASYSIPGIFRPFNCRFADHPACPCPRALFLRAQGITPDEYYVDGGVRDYYPISIPPKFTDVKLLFGVNLGYLGQREADVAKGGLPEILAQTLDIFGMDQYESDKRDVDIALCKLITLDPGIRDIGILESVNPESLIKRAYEATITLFNQSGLKPGKGEENIRKLFEAKGRYARFNF